MGFISAIIVKWWLSYVDLQVYSSMEHLSQLEHKPLGVTLREHKIPREDRVVKRETLGSLALRDKSWRAGSPEMWVQTTDEKKVDKSWKSVATLNRFHHCFAFFQETLILLRILLYREWHQSTIWGSKTFLCSYGYPSPCLSSWSRFWATDSFQAASGEGKRGVPGRSFGGHPFYSWFETIH